MEIVVGDISSYIKDAKNQPRAAALIRQVCRAHPDGYKFSRKYKSGMWDGYISLMHSIYKFPSGLLWLVAERLKNEGFHLTFKVESDFFLYDEIKEDALQGITLRNYQIEAVNTLLKSKRGVAKMATNAGKTEVMAGIIKALNIPETIILLHRKELMYQTAARFKDRLGIDIGLIGDGVLDKKQVTVAMIQTVSKSQKTFPNNKLLMVDECFVAGTLVDGVPIENIKIGDYVTAYDENREMFVKSRVLRTFVNDLHSDLIKICGDNKEIVCTDNHPIYTYDGWKCAKDICIGDYIGVYDDSNICMFMVQERVSERQWKKTYSLCRIYKDILLERMFESVCLNEKFRNCVENKQEVCKCTNEIEQSYVQIRSKREGEQSIKSCESQTEIFRGEWERIACTTEIVGRTFEVENRICCGYEDSERTRLSYLLQNRYCKFEVEIGNRSGWSKPLWKETFGSEERSSIKWVGVDNIEVFKQGGDERYREMCRNNKVYNIEVEDYHNYIANGIVVHNCHHLSSNSYMDCMNRISGAYRFGFSGTPLKYDTLADMKLIAATGRVLVDVSNKRLIEEGYSAVPLVHLHTIEDTDNSNWLLRYPDAYSTLIVGNVKRNKIIANVAKKAQGTVLILVNFVEHGKTLQTMIPGSTFVHGSDAIEHRMGVLNSMREQGAGVFIASPIFDEGIDVPSLDNVILACGGKSYIKLLQRIGRGLRKKDNHNVLNVYDFIDDTNKYLLQHSDDRVDTYVSEGFETILV